MKTLGDRIQFIIDQTGHSQVSLGELCGVSTQAVHQWINGHTKNIRNQTLFRLARGTGFSAEWIATGEGPPRVVAVKDPSMILDLSDLTDQQRVVIRAAVDASKKQECG